jgi:1-acyl-sn-glycerol-3-phosphate acyltransferase
MPWLVDDEILARVRRIELPWSRHGIDPYGIDQVELARMFTTFGWFYRRYFDMHVSGVPNVPARGRVMLIGNHSGGFALDGAMTLTALFFEMEPPRLAQAMAERFINRLPFASLYSSKTGNIVGTPENAMQLLEQDRALIIFPEGARGTAKLYGERHSLVRFGTGFVRLAMRTRTPIVPFAFVGGGDAVPTVANLYRLGKLFGVPYVPITPYLLPIPRPVPLHLLFAPPITFDGTGEEEDAVIQRHVEQVKGVIAGMIDETVRGNAPGGDGGAEVAQ